MTAGDLDTPLLGRIVRPVDYVRVLATPLRLRSPHFALHHLEGRPLPLKRPLTRSSETVPRNVASDVESDVVSEADTAIHAPVTASLSTELSTGLESPQASVVDDFQVDEALVAGGGRVDDGTVVPLPVGPRRWLGLVVPKRHAKRAVTRTLVKRQIRNVAADCAQALAPGLWVLRQRAPFDPAQFPSAASDALKEVARAELRALFERAVRGERDRVKPRNPSTMAAKGSKGGRKPASAKASAPLAVVGQGADASSAATPALHATPPEGAR